MFKVQFVRESGKIYNSGSFSSLFDAISFMKELQTPPISIKEYKATLDNH